MLRSPSISSRNRPAVTRATWPPTRAAPSRSTIQADGQDWRAITGLQIEGRAQVVSTPEEWRVAYETFRAKFPFVGEAWQGEGSAAPILAGPLARSRFYRITPHWIRLIDNTLGFGHKDELRL